MKIEQVWQFQLTTNEKISLENVYDMAQNAMGAQDYDLLPDGVREIISDLARTTSDILENATEI